MVEECKEEHVFVTVLALNQEEIIVLRMDQLITNPVLAMTNPVQVRNTHIKEIAERASILLLSSETIT